MRSPVGSESRGKKTNRRAIGRVRGIAEILAVLAAVMLTASLLGPHLEFPYVALVLYGGVLAAWALLRWAGEGWKDLGLGLPRRWKTTLAAALAIAAIGLALFAGVRISGLPPLDLSVLRDAIEGDLATLLLTLLVVVWGTAAFAEELLFRGFVLHRLEAVFRGAPGAVGWAVGMQATLFGLAHAYQGPTGILYTGLVGVLMGIACRIRGRTLWVAILAHGGIDTVAVILLYAGAL